MVKQMHVFNLKALSLYIFSGISIAIFSQEYLLPKKQLF